MVIAAVIAPAPSWPPRGGAHRTPPARWRGLGVAAVMRTTCSGDGLALARQQASKTRWRRHLAKDAGLYDVSSAALRAHRRWGDRARATGSKAGARSSTALAPPRGAGGHRGVEATRRPKLAPDHQVKTGRLQRVCLVGDRGSSPSAHRDGCVRPTGGSAPADRSRPGRGWRAAAVAVDEQNSSRSTSRTSRGAAGAPQPGWPRTARTAESARGHRQRTDKIARPPRERRPCAADKIARGWARSSATTTWPSTSPSRSPTRHSRSPPTPRPSPPRPPSTASTAAHQPARRHPARRRVGCATRTRRRRTVLPHPQQRAGRRPTATGWPTGPRPQSAQLSYHLSWHMKQALAPTCSTTTTNRRRRQTRQPVAARNAPTSTRQSRAQTHRRRRPDTAHQPARRPATICANHTSRPTTRQHHHHHQPHPAQRQALELLAVSHPTTQQALLERVGAGRRPGLLQPELMALRAGLRNFPP